LALIWLMMVLLMHYPNLIECYYSGGLYLGICHIFHPVFNLFPFSVGDVLYIALVIYLIVALVRIIRFVFTKKFRQVFIYLLKLTIGFQAIILAFYLLWGLNYFRPSAAKRLSLQDSTYTFDDIKLVTAMLIDSANFNRSQLTTADLNQNDQAIYQTAVNAISAMANRSTNFPAYHPHIKPSILSFVLNYIGTSGYYNPFTSEAQINYQMPVFLKPFTACHEMSHQLGFGAEDEADFGGFVTGIASHNRLLKYSSYYSGVEAFMYTVSRKDTVAYKQLKKRISPPVLNDYKADRVYWKSFEGKAGILSSVFYDNFLKTNNQPQGLKTYNQMIKLVMAWYSEDQTIKKLRKY